MDSEKTDRANSLISDPSNMSFMEFLDRVKLFCMTRRVHIPNNEQCFGCPIEHFCHAVPAEYHVDLIFQTLKQIQDL